LASISIDWLPTHRGSGCLIPSNYTKVVFHPTPPSPVRTDMLRVCSAFTIKMSTAEKLAMGKTDEFYGRQNL
jgi:hypothetical protein